MTIAKTLTTVRRSLAWMTNPNQPFRPDQFPLFYGWVILGVTTIGIMMSLPGQTAGVSVFTDYLISAHGISRLSLSNAYLIGTLSSGLMLPLGGVLLDRLGARLVVVVSSIWLGITLMVLSWSDRMAEFLATALNSSQPPVSLVLLGGGFISLRLSGQGMLTMVSQTTLGKWFDKRRGMVSGTSGVVIAFGFAGAPLALSGLIGLFGWRGSWQLLAIAVGVGMSTLGWLFYRDSPEICGLEMDGNMTQPNPSSPLNQLSETQDKMVPIVPTVRDFTRPEALRTVAFWAVALALSSQSLIITGITFHIVDIGALAGLSETQTVAIFLPISVVSTIVGYLIGIASDRAPLRLLFISMMIAQAIGIACIASLDVFVLRAIATVGIGFSAGCFGTLTTVTLPRFFGRMHLGAIAGVQMMSMVIASAIGPSFLAIFKEIFGSYRPGLYTACLIPLGLVGLMTLIRNPQTQVTDADE